MASEVRKKKKTDSLDVQDTLRIVCVVAGQQSWREDPKALGFFVVIVAFSLDARSLHET